MIMATPKTIVFDWNGTLFDDAEAAHEATNAVLAHFGLAASSFAQFQEHFHIPLSRMYERFGLEPEAMKRHEAAVGTVFHDYYENLAVTLPLRAGAEALLALLRAEGATTVILSNHLESPIRAQLARLGIAEAIDHVMAFADRATQFAEPKGARLGRFMAQHGLDAGDVAIIGNSPEEIAIAREFGLTGVAITGGFVSAPRLQAAAPDILVSSLTEFDDWCRREFLA